MRHVTAIIALALFTSAPPSAAQTTIGPICLEVTVGNQESDAFTMFALPMGGDVIAGFQFLLSARSGGTPFNGPA